MLKKELVKAEDDSADEQEAVEAEDEVEAADFAFDLTDILAAVRDATMSFTGPVVPDAPEPVTEETIQKQLAQAQFAQAVLTGWKRTQQLTLDEWLAEKAESALQPRPARRRRKKAAPAAQMALF